MVLMMHVDKINNDNAAKVTQPKLPGNGMGCFHIGLENCIVKILSTDIASGVDINGC